MPPAWRTSRQKHATAKYAPLTTFLAHNHTPHAKLEEESRRFYRKTETEGNEWEKTRLNGRWGGEHLEPRV